MLTELWTGLGGKLSDRVITALISPALTFWCTGGLAWLYAHFAFADWFTAIHRYSEPFSGAPAVVQLILVLAMVTMLIASGLVVDSLTLTALRVMEGYWPKAFGPGRRYLVRRVTHRHATFLTRWRELRMRDEEDLNDDAVAELVRLDRRLRRIPLLARQHMPTRLGNVLRSAESRPVNKYGLDAAVCWPQLWLLLPDTTKTEIGVARGRLDRAAAGAVWGAMLLIWSVWTCWAPLAALTVIAVSYLAVVRMATGYADLVEAAWDVHRNELYVALRWPLPGTPADEYVSGRAITSYILRGSRAKVPTFTVGQD